jgi:hypothetical protein
MTQYKVYRIFSDLSSYFMVSKVKMNMCLNLLVSYYNKYIEDNKKEDCKPYFKIFDETEDDYDIEEMGSYDNRAKAKEALLTFINESTNCINTTTNESAGENRKKNGKLTITSDIKLYNKKKYIENKNKFKKYYEEHKDKIREYQKQRYQETKQKLKELEELKKETLI